jgi:hypothetical protein
VERGSGGERERRGRKEEGSGRERKRRGRRESEE